MKTRRDRAQLHALDHDTEHLAQTAIDEVRRLQRTLEARERRLAEAGHRRKSVERFALSLGQQLIAPGATYTARAEDMRRRAFRIVGLFAPEDLRDCVHVVGIRIGDFELLPSSVPLLLRGCIEDRDWHEVVGPGCPTALVLHNQASVPILFDGYWRCEAMREQPRPRPFGNATTGADIERWLEQETKQ